MQAITQAGTICFRRSVKDNRKFGDTVSLS